MYWETLIPPLLLTQYSERRMSTAREKRRKREAPMPAASAGLLRFFEEDTPGFKVGPEVVLMMSIGLVAVSLFLHIVFK